MKTDENTMLVALSPEEAELVAQLREHNARTDAFNCGLETAIDVLRSQNMPNEDREHLIWRVNGKRNAHWVLALKPVS